MDLDLDLFRAGPDAGPAEVSLTVEVAADSLTGLEDKM